MPSSWLMYDLAATVMDDACFNVEFGVEMTVGVETRAALVVAGLHPRLLDGQVTDVSAVLAQCGVDDIVPAAQVLWQGGDVVDAERHHVDVEVLRLGKLQRRPAGQTAQELAAAIDVGMLGNGSPVFRLEMNGSSEATVSIHFQILGIFIFI